MDASCALTLTLILALTGPGLGEPFKLGIGKTERFDQAGLVVTFREVSRDNRCPRDALCVVAGSATVVLTAQVEGAKSAELRFEIPPGGSASARFEAYEITVQTLEPEPKAGKPIDPEEYAATLVVVRRG